MKKIFLFAFALLASSAMQAQLQEYSAVELRNATDAGTSTINHVYSNAQGDIFFIGTAASNGDNPAVWYKVDTVETAPFRVNAKKTNSNLIFGKQAAKAETPSWFGASNRGNFSSLAATATNNGDLVMAVTFCHSDSNYLADNKALQMNMLTNTGIHSQNKLEGAYSVVNNKIENYGALVVATQDAWLNNAQVFRQIDGQADGFKFVDVATDGTNYYVLTLLNPGLVLESDTIRAAHKSGSIAVLKLNKEWKLAGYCVSEGTAGKNIGNLRYAGGKLYYSGNLTATKGGLFGMGGKTIETANAGNGIVLATLDTDLKCESLNLIETCAAAGKKNGALTIYDEVIDGANAYLTGFFMGGIVVAGGDTMSAANATAVLIKYDLSKGKIAQATHLESTAITGASSLIAHGDSIYMYAYDWATENRIALYGYDKELNAGDTIALVEATGKEVSNSAVWTEKGILAYSFRTDNTITFAADEKETYTAVDGFRAILAQQYLFKEPETAIDNTVLPTEKAVKYIQNGQLYIRRGEHIFNALGQQL